VTGVPGPGPGDHGVPRSVLIVDDNEFVRVILHSFFDSLTGWQVAGDAADGTEAIPKAEEAKPDVILLDLSMPGMSGIETASVLKKSSPNSRVILFTMYADSLGSRLPAAAGIDLVVSKVEGLGGLLKAMHDVTGDAGSIHG
jgi:DNA-binding NarL/FixJ family response regulator